MRTYSNAILHQEACLGIFTEFQSAETKWFICTPSKKPLHSERKYVPLHTDSADTESYTILLSCSDWPRDSTDITVLDKWMDEVQFHKGLQAISTNERET